MWDASTLLETDGMVVILPSENPNSVKISRVWLVSPLIMLDGYWPKNSPSAHRALMKLLHLLCPFKPMATELKVLGRWLNPAKLFALEAVMLQTHWIKLMIANSQEVTIHYHASTLMETDGILVMLPSEKINTVMILPKEHFRPKISLSPNRAPSLKVLHQLCPFKPNLTAVKSPGR